LKPCIEETSRAHRYAALAAVIPNDWRVRFATFADDPFTLGVGSGDPPRPA
jgi:hypothetical protein